MFKGKLKNGEDRLDAAVTDALRSAPLAPPPPLLYAAVMHRLRSEPKPRFRIPWLDLALGLFAAMMPGVLWLAWRSAPVNWKLYLRLQTEWSLQMLWYLEREMLLWSGLLLLAVFAVMAAAALALWLRPRLAL